MNTLYVFAFCTGVQVNVTCPSPVVKLVISGFVAAAAGVAYLMSFAVKEVYFEPSADERTRKPYFVPFVKLVTFNVVSVVSPTFAYFPLKQCLYEHENSPHDGSNKNLKPITYRIKRDGGKWYIQLMIKVPPADIKTNKSDGVIALKYGQGYIQEAETDRFGNLVGLENHKLIYYGQGNKAVTEMQLTIARIVCKAITLGKSIITEDIDMMTRKTTAKGKKNRQRLSQFDYARFASSVDCSCYKRGAEHEIVNPANTVYIGREKYAESRKLSDLQAAAYVAARVGQGFSDKINGKSTYIRKIKKAA